MLPRRNRIVEPSDFRAVIRHGDKCVSNHIIGYRLKSAKTRVGIIVTNRFGNAVARNTARRRVRAIAAELIRQGKLTGDIIFRLRPEAGAADFQQISDDIDDCLVRWATHA